jgi:hypothetical protein
MRNMQRRRGETKKEKREKSGELQQREQQIWQESREPGEAYL